MKTSKVITVMMMALALSAVPALAQSPTRGGGGGRSGGSVSSPSRSSGSSFSGSSRSSSSFSGSSSRSYSSPSRSNSSFSNSSRSTTSPSRSNNSYSSPSRSTTSPSRGSGIPSSARRAGTVGSGSNPSPSRSVGSATRSGVRGGGAPAGTVGSPTRSNAGGSINMPPNGSSATASPTRAGAPGAPSAPGATGYARPGRPGGYMPPASRPIHPAPYFYHPWHHHMVHCHPLFWDPLPPRPWYWPGFWLYCNSYWYDYHVTDVVVVRRYVQDTYNVDMVTYGISGDIMYAIVRDGGETYLQVYDKNDHLLAEQKINRKYCNMVIDSENGGCWISKKHDKDPLLFIWADGQLLIYEAD
ncbi:MAG: hypothetical protein J6Y52_02130 [Bacteroidales bacterium]|nr:hypothetical protein [Bacteroidales bacterium]